VIACGHGFIHPSDPLIAGDKKTTSTWHSYPPGSIGKGETTDRLLAGKIKNEKKLDHEFRVGSGAVD